MAPIWGNEIGRGSFFVNDNYANVLWYNPACLVRFRRERRVRIERKK